MSEVSQSERDQLLAEAHDHHLVTGFFGTQELLLAPRRPVPRYEPAQLAFSDLLHRGLVHECGRDGFDDGLRCRSIYAPTTAGMARLRDIALEMDGAVRLTEVKWQDSTFSLAWEEGHSLWEVYQGTIAGIVENDAGATTADETVVAEVGVFRLNGAITSASGISLAEAVHCLPELQSYGELPIDKNHRTVDFDELPAALGLGSASSANVIILDRIKIKAAFLGLGLGAQIIRRLLLLLGAGGGIAVLAPFPLQFGGRTDVATDENAYQAAVDSLRRYYSGLGFVAHKGAAGLMVCDLENKLLRRVPIQARYN